MVALSQIEDDLCTRVLIIGLPGTGKSTLATKLASRFKLTWFDLENSAKIFKSLPEDCKPNIDYINIPDSASYPIAADTMVNLFKIGRGTICATHGKLSCVSCSLDPSMLKNSVDFSKLDPKKDIVVVDTMTQLSASILSHTIRDEKIEYKLKQDDWGEIRKYSEFICSQSQAAKFNLVCIAHLSEVKSIAGQEKYGPNFGTKAMGAQFAKAFDHVILCETFNGAHIAGSRSTYNNSVVTKSRTGFAIEDLKEPSLLPVFDSSIELPMKEKADTTNTAIAPTNGQTAQSNLKALMEKMGK